MNKRKTKKMSRYIWVYSDKTRLAVVDMLRDKSLSVKQMLVKLKIEATLFSHHLSVLKKAGVIVSTRKGKSNIYSRGPKYFAMTNTLEPLFVK